MTGDEFTPRDLLQAAPWKYALFTTYSLSLSFLESVPLTALASNQDLTILVDLEGYRSSLSDAGAVSAGRSYELVPLDVTSGVFHPKICVVIDGAGQVRAAVGSGNLTFGGWGRNAEVIDVLLPETDARAFGDLANFFDQLMERTKLGSRIKSDRSPDLSRYAEACRGGSSAPTDGATRVIHTLSGRLDQQIADQASELGGAISLTVVSPFFSGHHAVKALATALGCSDVAVAVPPLAPSIFDFAAARAAGVEVRSVTCDMFSGARSLHAKLFDVECARGRLIVSGSGNATNQALGGQNVEAMVVRVHDRARVLGWRPCGTYGTASGEREPRPAKEPCLVARYDGSQFTGRVFGTGDLTGEWTGRFLAGSIVELLGPVLVRPDGAFSAACPDALDPSVLNMPGQVSLERGGLSIRGWLMLDAILAAVREKGPLARSVMRMLHGIETATDVAGFLAYITAHPEEMLGAALAHGFSNLKNAKKPDTHPGAIVPLSNLAPIDALAVPGTSAGEATDGAFDALLRTLCKRLDQHLTTPEQDEEEDGEAVQNRKKSVGAKGHKPKVSNREVGRALDKLCERLLKVPAGPGRGAALPTLFNMIIFIAPHAEQPDDLLLPNLKRWRWIARGSRTGGDELDSLDQTMATLLTSGVINGVHSATEGHSELQRWLGRTLSAADQVMLAPDFRSLDAQRTARDATADSWAEAWTSLTGTRTSWAAASQLLTALQNGMPYEVPSDIRVDEVEILRRIGAGGLSIDRIAVARGPADAMSGCPKCHSALPTLEKARLRQHRIASCRNRCGRIVLDLTL